MKINFIILAALLFFMPMTSKAMTIDNNTYEYNDVQKPTHFILYLNSGERITFVVANQPKIIHYENSISIEENGNSIEYGLEDIHKYMLGEETPTGIAKINEATGSIKNGVGTIILSGFKAGASVVISSINGTVVCNETINDNGSLNINTTQFAEGIYIVKVQNKTLKFTKR